MDCIEIKGLRFRYFIHKNTTFIPMPEFDEPKERLFPRKEITEEYLINKYGEAYEQGSYPTSSYPNKVYYKWRIQDIDGLVIETESDTGYSLCMRYPTECDYDEILIRYVKYIDDLEDILRVLTRNPEEEL